MNFLLKICCKTDMRSRKYPLKLMCISHLNNINQLVRILQKHPQFYEDILHAL